MNNTAEQVQAIRLAIKSLQEDQWDCGYSDERVRKIQDLKAQLNALLNK